jgi:hypothetical protein
MLGWDGRNPFGDLTPALFDPVKADIGLAEFGPDED